MRREVLDGGYEKLKHKGLERMRPAMMKGMGDSGAQLIQMGPRVAVRWGVGEDEMLQWDIAVWVMNNKLTLCGWQET